jgi:hypothetical protein
MDATITANAAAAGLRLRIRISCSLDLFLPQHSPYILLGPSEGVASDAPGREFGTILVNLPI